MDKITIQLTVEQYNKIIETLAYNLSWAEADPILKSLVEGRNTFNKEENSQEEQVSSNMEEVDDASLTEPVI